MAHETGRFYQLGNELRPEHGQFHIQLVVRFYQLGNELRPEPLWQVYRLQA